MRGGTGSRTSSRSTSAISRAFRRSSTACWRLGLFVYALGTGRNIFTAGLTLALLILPIIVVATREALRAVPASLREAAYGIGCTKWQVTSDHVLPAALPGVLTGIIIGISRALGETAPLITIGALTFIAFLPAPPVTRSFRLFPSRGCSTASRCCRFRRSTGFRGPAATSMPTPRRPGSCFSRSRLG